MRGGGSPPLLPQELDVRLSPEDWLVPGGGQCPGSFATGGVIVMDDTVCMVDAALNLMQFYARESCAACPPCRTGTPWLRDILKRLECGQGGAGDLELLREVATQVSPLLSEQRSTLCSFGQDFAWPLQGFLQRFADEFSLHAQAEGCPVKKDLGIKTPETVSVRF